MCLQPRHNPRKEPPPDPPLTRPRLPPLQWSTQPIYVLDKDNDLDVAALALRNAEDIVRVQPEGPYLLGGHSYGGCVATEIAMVLESWGKEVGLVLVSDPARRRPAAKACTPRPLPIRAPSASAVLLPHASPDHPTPPPQVMDTPRQEQNRTAQPDAEQATDEDTMELIEMILGALGRDALGMGASMAHPAESDQWKGMTMMQRYEFFAPIWRVMRDSNMSVEEVVEQASMGGGLLAS